MKKIIIFIIALISIGSISFANDCKNVSHDNNWDTIILKNWNKGYLLSNKDIGQSVLNLQKFCCGDEILSDWLNYCNVISKDGIYPSSAYLFDHILDVSIRKLDAKVEDENGKNLLYNLEPDTVGKEWRDFITKHGNSSNGSVPLEIVNEYKRHWQIKSNLLTDWSPNNKIPWWENVFENYDEWSLWEKYNWICETSIYMYISLVPDADTKKLSLAYRNCKSLINARIRNEYDYTKTVLMQKWNKLLNINIKTYLDSYFSQDKMTALQQLVFNIKNTFSEINKAIPELVPNCSS